MISLIDSTFAGLSQQWAPPPNLTLSQWADLHRRLSPEASAEPGRWQTSRTPYMREIMDAVGDPLCEWVVVMSSAQVGKALAIDTPIATPDGWTTMGEIAPGDYVFGRDGMPTKVLGVSPIMEDRGCYSVRFSDGSEIVADDDHLWAVDSDTRLSNGDFSGVLRTSQIAESAKYGARKHRNRYAIPVASPLQLDAKVLPIDPYVLGVWLGDGHSASSRMFCHVDDSVHFEGEIQRAGHRTSVSRSRTAVDIRIDPKERNVCPYGHDKDKTGWAGLGCAECGRLASANWGRKKRGSALIERTETLVQTLPRMLRSLGLIRNKHIPAIYLRASYEQRLALLQGLMDTDGYVDARGRSEFITTSPVLADGFAELLASLGVKHTRVTKNTTCRHSGKLVNGTAYRFSFLVYRDVPIFRLPRKLERMKGADGCRTTETTRRRIVAVDRVQSVPVRCIAVDAPDHLFLAGRQMIPTHNTELILNALGYTIHYDPAPMLVLQPTLDMAQAFSKDRLSKMIRDTPALRERVSEAKSRDSANTMLHKVFPGGHITLAGTNSPSALASRPIRKVLLDEVDRYELSAGTEGDPASLAVKRTTTFWNRQIIAVSTPGLKGQSRIEVMYLESDQRQYHVPCPHCGAEQVMEWHNVRWPDGRPEEAAYHCETCGERWSESDRRRAIEGGRWIAQKPFNGRAGFRLSELNSTWSTPANMAQAYEEAKGSPERLKTWVNTALGETYEEGGETVEPHALQARAETYAAEVPAGVLLLTAGVDTQDDRLEVEVVGWGKGEESWNIDYQVIYGDPEIPEGHPDSPWTALTDLLERYWQHETAGPIRIQSTCIDSGGSKTQAVYNYCKGKRARRVFAIKGVAGGDRPVVAASQKKRTGENRRPVHLHLVAVDQAKDTIYGRLGISAPGRGYCHFPEAREPIYYEQLTGERKLIEKDPKGFPRRVWKAIEGRRNEALDCRVYAYAAMILRSPRWDALEARQRAIEIEVAPKDEPLVVPPAPKHPEPTSAKPPKDPTPVKRHNTGKSPRRRPGGGFVNSWRH